MSLTTISTQFFRQTFPYLRKRLLFAYIVVMAVILCIAETLLYFFLINVLNQQLDHELLTLVETAVPRLNTIETRSIEISDTNLSWRNFFAQEEQSLEWYDASGKLLAQEGTLTAKLPLALDKIKRQQDTPFFQQESNIRTVTVSVYDNNLEDENLVLKGYIRATDSTVSMQSTFNKLRLGLGLGGSTALILVSISSIYLTQEAVKPVRQVFLHLGQFTSDISHQLRTPLTRISMATEIMLAHKEAIQPSDARKLSIINNSTEQMKRLIEDMLFLLRSETFPNAVQLGRKKISLNQLLQVVIDEYEPALTAKEINFEARLSHNTLIAGDSSQLHRLFSNILENSVSYTKPGDSIRISIEKYKRKIIVCIQDTGMGISAEDIPYIYQYFWRSEMAKQNKRDSFGLGLTVAQAIARQHHSKLLVTSRIDYGTLFKVIMPVV